MDHCEEKRSNISHSGGSGGSDGSGDIPRSHTCLLDVNARCNMHPKKPADDLHPELDMAFLRPLFLLATLRKV